MITVFSQMILSMGIHQLNFKRFTFFSFSFGCIHQFIFNLANVQFIIFLISLSANGGPISWFPYAIPA